MGSVLLMNKPWMGNNMGHKIYKVKKLNKQLFSRRKQNEENVTSEVKKKNKVSSMVVKTPFCVVSEVKNFLINPISSERRQEVFVFENNNVNNQFRELETKLVTTSFYYYEEPYCKMISSKISEKRILLELDTKKHMGDILSRNKEESLWIPVHNLIIEKEKEGFAKDIRGELPVELGRYKTEITLQEMIEFEGKVIGFKKISQDVILTKSKLVLPGITGSNSKEIVIEKSFLFVEGYLFQTIEYIMDNNQSCEKFYYLMQNIVLEMVIKILQNQEL